MRTLGSLSLCRSLLEAGLVDRFRVVVFPVITGSTGRDRIYDGYPDVALDMVASQTFDGRIQLLEYVPKLLTGPPGSACGFLSLRTGERVPAPANGVVLVLGRGRSWRQTPVSPTTARAGAASRSRTTSRQPKRSTP